MGEVIAAQCQLKLKENQEANLTTEKEILKVEEANQILELYRVIGEIAENPSGTELREKREIETEWESL